MYHFEENDVVMPIAVLEELDQSKKGNEPLNFHAREFGRAPDNLSGDKLINGRVKIGSRQVRVSLRPAGSYHPHLEPNFSCYKPDHHILNAAYQIYHPYLDNQANGLSFLIEKTQGQNLRAHVNLEKSEPSELAELASDQL